MFIPIDEAFPAHRKTLRFCGLMQDHNAFAYLIRLWAWAARSAPDGELVGLDPMTIELAIQYRHTDGRCYAAMVKAGFIDEDEPGIPARIHGWMDHTGASIQRMEAAAKASRTRKQEWRERRTRDADVTAAETPVERVRNAGQDVSAQHENAHRTDKARQGQEDQDPDLSLSGPSGSLPGQAGARSNPSAGFGGLAPPRPAREIIPVGLVTEPFLRVYGAYPRKEGKTKAAVVFAELAAQTPGGEEALSEKILAAFGAGMLRRHPYAGPNATRPMLETILAERRWEDLPSDPDDAPPPERRFEPIAVVQERQRREAALDAKVERTIRDLTPTAPIKSPRQEWLEKQQQAKGAAGT